MYREINEGDAHLLIDEYFAIISDQLSIKTGKVERFHRLISEIRSERICWIVLDPLQPIDEKNFAPDIKIPGMEMAHTSYLLTVERCTESVFKQWNTHCGRFVVLGHHYQGVPAEEQIVPDLGSEETFAPAVADMVATAAKMEIDAGWRMCDFIILIDDKNLYGYSMMEEIWSALKERIAIYPLGLLKSVNSEGFI